MSDRRRTVERMRYTMTDVPPATTGSPSGNSPNPPLTARFADAGCPFTEVFPPDVAAVELSAKWSADDALAVLRRLARETARLEALRAVAVGVLGRAHGVRPTTSPHPPTSPHPAAAADPSAILDPPPEPEPAPEPDPAEEAAIAEIRRELRMASSPATELFRTGWRLSQDLPATLDALDRGLIDSDRAQAVLRVTRPLNSALGRMVEEETLTDGARPSHTSFAAALRRKAASIDPAGAAQRKQPRRREPDVGLTPRTQGLSQLWALLPADTAQAAFAAIETLAESATSTEDPREPGQRRADAFTNLLLTSPVAQRLPTHPDHVASEARTPGGPPPARLSTPNPAPPTPAPNAPAPDQPVRPQPAGLAQTPINSQTRLATKNDRHRNKNHKNRNRTSRRGKASKR
jgi:hypothetical protein